MIFNDIIKIQLHSNENGYVQKPLATRSNPRYRMRSLMVWGCIKRKNVDANNWKLNSKNIHIPCEIFQLDREPYQTWQITKVFHQERHCKCPDETIVNLYSSIQCCVEVVACINGYH